MKLTLLRCSFGQMGSKHVASLDHLRLGGYPWVLVVLMAVKGYREYVVN